MTLASKIGLGIAALGTKLSEFPFASRRCTESNSWRFIMNAMFGLLFYLLPLPLVFTHEHSNAVPEIDRKFLDNLQRPDNRPDERFDKKSKSCCTDKDAVKVEYKMVVPEGAKYPEPEWYVWIESYKTDGTPGEYKWVKVPSEKIVEEYSPSGQAYVYVIARGIQCFVRPQTRF